MSLGPVQLLIVGFDGAGPTGEVLAELERLPANDAVRVLDVLVVNRDDDGVVRCVARPEAGLVEALIGLDDDTPAEVEPLAEELWSLEEAIPNGSSALIALVEHRWAIGTRDMILAAGSATVADAWIHPDELAAALSATGRSSESRLTAPQ